MGSRGVDVAGKQHPFIDRAQISTIVTGPFRLYSPSGGLVAAVVRHAYPEKIADLAASLLREVPTTSNMRAAIYGGQLPLTGIAGYFDYSGTPLTFKCRKTAFTHSHLQAWPCVFPFVEYLNALYQAVAPSKWEAQNKAIPDAVRIRRSVFSTLTVNQRFRTAAHTDVGDYDEGMGLLTVLEGQYEGMHLVLPDFDLCLALRPRDVLIFDTHYLHCNSEPETPEWDRLACVLYYRVKLGGADCWRQYRRRKAEHDQNSALPLTDQPEVAASPNLRKQVAAPPSSVLTLIAGAAATFGAQEWVQRLQRLAESHEGLRCWLSAEPLWKTRHSHLCIRRPLHHFEPLNLQHVQRPRKRQRTDEADSRGDTDLLVRRFLADLDGRAAGVVQPLREAVDRCVQEVALLYRQRTGTADPTPAPPQTSPQLCSRGPPAILPVPEAHSPTVPHGAPSLLKGQQAHSPRPVQATTPTLAAPSPIERPTASPAAGASKLHHHHHHPKSASRMTHRDGRHRLPLKRSPWAASTDPASPAKRPKVDAVVVLVKQLYGMVWDPVRRMYRRAERARWVAPAVGEVAEWRKRPSASAPGVAVAGPSKVKPEKKQTTIVRVNPVVVNLVEISSSDSEEAKDLRGPRRAASAPAPSDTAGSGSLPPPVLGGDGLQRHACTDPTPNEGHGDHTQQPAHPKPEPCIGTTDADAGGAKEQSLLPGPSTSMTSLSPEVSTPSACPPSDVPPSATPASPPPTPGQPVPALQASKVPSSDAGAVDGSPHSGGSDPPCATRGVPALRGFFWRAKQDASSPTPRPSPHSRPAKPSDPKLLEHPPVRAALQTVFTLCDLPAYGGQGLMNLLVGATHLSSAQRDQFWGALLRHMHLRCVQEFGVPESLLGFSAFLDVFHRYNASCKKEVDVRFEDPLMVPAGEGHPASWIYIDSFDYQTEDREVQWELEGLPRPAEGLRLDRQAEPGPGSPREGSPGPLNVTLLRAEVTAAPPPDDAVQRCLQQAMATLPTDADTVAEYLRATAAVLEQHFLPLEPHPRAAPARLLAVDAAGNTTAMKDRASVDPTALGATSVVREPSDASPADSDSSTDTDTDDLPSSPAPDPQDAVSSSSAGGTARPLACDGGRGLPPGEQRRPPEPPLPGWHRLIDAAGNRWGRPATLPDLQRLLQVMGPQWTALRHAHDQALPCPPADDPDLAFREVAFSAVVGAPDSNLPGSPLSCGGDQHVVVVDHPHLLDDRGQAALFCAAHRLLRPRGVLIVHEFDAQCREFHRLTPRWQTAAAAATPALLATFDAVAGRRGSASNTETSHVAYRDAAAWRRAIEPHGFTLSGLHYDKGDALGTVHLVFARAAAPPPPPG